MKVSEFLDSKIISETRVVSLLEMGIEGIHFDKMELEYVEEFQKFNPYSFKAYKIAEYFHEDGISEYGYIKFDGIEIAIYKKSYIHRSISYRIVDRKKYQEFIKLLTLFKTSSVYGESAYEDDISNWLPVDSITVEYNVNGATTRKTRPYETWTEEQIFTRRENMVQFPAENTMSYGSITYYEDTITALEDELTIRKVPFTKAKRID